MAVKFEDNSIQVKAAINDAAIAFLHEVSELMKTQVARNSRVKSGELKNSWSYVVDESKGEAQIGSPLENAIWEEFGTGEYAVNGDGRKGGWLYEDEKGKHFTYGKKPNRALQSAYNTLKPTIVSRAEKVLKGGLE